MLPITPQFMSQLLNGSRAIDSRAAGRLTGALIAATVWTVAVASPSAHGQDGLPSDGYVPVRIAPDDDRLPTLEAEPYASAPAPARNGARQDGALTGEAFDVPTPLPARGGDEQVLGFPEPPEFGRAEVPGPPRPAVDALPGTPFFADTEYGARPTPGVPGAPGFGLPHRMEETNRYGIWYLPKLFHAPNRAVYRPSPWRPRGFGNLFDRPCVQDRMDYTPYTVEDLPSRYGPTYYPHFRENTECLIRPTRHYDHGPHAENSTGGCRLGGDCYHAAGLGDCPGCRPAGFLKASRTASANGCQCDKCRANR